MEKILGLPKIVFVLGVVSFFMDISSEMIVPLLPIFLNDVLFASKVSIGFIEGIAESTASILKVVSGWFSDRIGKRKPLIFWGYSLSVFSRPILAGASSWIGVLVYRFTDRLGKGIRTSPRDALITDVTDHKIIGRAFGFHRAMDTVGAVFGPAIAFGILALTDNNLRLVFWFSIIPGLMAIGTIGIFIKDVAKKQKVKDNPLILEKKVSYKELNKRFKLFLFITALFTIGKIPEAFLILRAKELGVDIRLIPVLYLSFNITTALLATPSGIVADRIGIRKIILLSYMIAAFTFAGFAFANRLVYSWLLFIMYGVFVAMNEGNQRAFVSSLIDPERRGTGYGIYHTIVGLAALPGGLICGALFQFKGSFALFIYGLSLSLASAIMFYLFMLRHK